MAVETPRSLGDDLSVRRTDRYRCARFVVRGVVDARTAPRLTGPLLAACRDPAVDVVAIDLAGVTFVSAAALSCLDRVAAAARTHHTAVSLWDPTPHVRRVLAAGGIDPSILIEPPGPR